MKYNFLATGIGSVPFTDVNRALDTVISYLPEIPFWPQLPKLSHLEQMAPQYSATIPGEENSDSGDVSLSAAAADSALLEQFFTEALAENFAYFDLPAERAVGYHAFMERLESGQIASDKLVALKGHITGPLTFAFMMKDQAKKSVLYDDALLEVATTALAMQARAMVRRLKKFSERVIIFMDEPCFSSLGTVALNIEIAQAIEVTNTVAKAIQSEGALVGVHCCGNTDWQVLFDAKIDIINFDAYSFFDKFVLYAQNVPAYLERGGLLAWGIVPTDKYDGTQTASGLAAMLQGQVESLASAAGVSVAQIAAASLVTPSCGMGSLSEADTIAILELLTGLSVKMQATFPRP